jgi:hypothetical protein
MPPCYKYWAADAVFTGVVTSVTYTADQKLSHTTLVVERGFRGASGQVVITGQALSSCHYSFTVGQRYVVYARRSADGTLTTDYCSGNKLLAEAAEDLDYAENVPPPGSGGRVFGRRGGPPRPAEIARSVSIGQSSLAPRLERRDAHTTHRLRR